MPRLSARRTLPVSREEGFDYITDVRNWHTYWPSLVDVPAADTVSWSRSGDRATVVLELRGRPVEMSMHLDEFRPYERVAYDSTQAGLPDFRHERIFRDDDGRLDYELAISFDPRAGRHWLVDRTVVPGVVRRSLATTLDNLERIFSGAP